MAVAAAYEHLHVSRNVTISLFPELGGNLDDQLPVACIWVHRTHGRRVGAREVVQIPPKNTHKNTHNIKKALNVAILIILKHVLRPTSDIRSGLV